MATRFKALKLTVLEYYISTVSTHPCIPHSTTNISIHGRMRTVHVHKNSVLLLVTYIHSVILRKSAVE